MSRTITIAILLAALLTGCMSSVTGEVTSKRSKPGTESVRAGKYYVERSRIFYYVELDGESEIEVSPEVYEGVEIGWTCTFSSDKGHYNYMKCEVE